MAARTLSVTTPSLAGQSVSSVSSALASSDTCVISPTTAQSSLDFASLHLRITNTSSTAAVVLTIAAGSKFSGISLGTKAVTVGTGDTVIVGGQDFESARFLNCTSGTVTLTAAGTGPTSIEAYQNPRASE